jgi:hypothetical protein
MGSTRVPSSNRKANSPVYSTMAEARRSPTRARSALMPARSDRSMRVPACRFLAQPAGQHGRELARSYASERSVHGCQAILFRICEENLPHFAALDSVSSGELLPLSPLVAPSGVHASGGTLESESGNHLLTSVLTGGSWYGRAITRLRNLGCPS